MNPFLREELVQLLNESIPETASDCRAGRSEAVSKVLVALFLPALFLGITGTPWALVAWVAWVASWATLMAVRPRIAE